MRRRWIYFIIVTGLLVIGVATSQAQAGDPCEEQGCVKVAYARVRYGLTEAQIRAYEQPHLGTLMVDANLLYDRRYMRIAGAVDVYDAPNGNLIKTFDAGFNFITAYDRRDDWISINPGEWVRAEQLTDANDIISHFTGVFLPGEPLQYPVAWMLVNAYPASEPGGSPDESHDIIWRYTRLTLYATVELEGWRWYQVGPDQWVHQTQVAKVIPVARPEDVDTERWVGVDLYEQVLVVYEGETPIFATLVSTGLDRWPTYEGLFHIYYRTTREYMSWGTPGDDFYFLEEVPWTMFFDFGRALHGAYWHDGLGYRRSHGCVNISITDAHWLYNWVAEDFDDYTSPDVEEGPAVYVYSSGEYR